MKFTFLSGDSNWLKYGASWVSPKLYNHDFDYWLVMELINLKEEAPQDDWPGKYHASLAAVSIQQAGPENIEAALGCCGVPEHAEDDPMAQVEALHSYGVEVILWSEFGNSAHRLLRNAQEEAALCEMMFGVYMDRCVNRIGTTGWEAIKGDIMAGLNRAPAP